MPADPRINMAYQGVQLDNPLAVASQGESLKAQQRQNALAQQQMDEYNSPEAQADRDRQGKRKQQADAVEDIKMVLPTLNPDNWNRFGEYMQNTHGDAGIFGQPYNEEAHSQMLERFGITKPAGQGAAAYSGSQMVAEDGRVMAFNKRTGQFEDTGQRMGLKPNQTPEYRADVTRATELAKTDVKQSAPSSPTERREAQDAIGMINELKNFDLGSIYGRGEKYYPDLLRSQEGVDMLAKRDLVVDSLNLVAAGKLKGQGQITENEREMLKRAATMLGNQNISPEAAKKELDRVIPAFEEIINRGAQAGMQQPQMGGANRMDSTTSFANQVPQAAIDYLTANPNFAPQFDAKYGQGASAFVLGQ